MPSLRESPAGQSAAAALFAVPWCCAVPAALSIASLAGAAAARLWLARVVWLLLPLSAALLARAFWLLYVRGHDAPWARRVTWASAAIAIALWTPRLASLL